MLNEFELSRTDDKKIEEKKKAKNVRKSKYYKNLVPEINKAEKRLLSFLNLIGEGTYFNNKVTLFLRGNSIIICYTALEKPF